MTDALDLFNGALRQYAQAPYTTQLIPAPKPNALMQASSAMRQHPLFAELMRCYKKAYDWGVYMADGEPETVGVALGTMSWFFDVLQERGIHLSPKDQEHLSNLLQTAYEHTKAREKIFPAHVVEARTGLISILLDRVQELGAQTHDGSEGKPGQGFASRIASRNSGRSLP